MMSLITLLKFFWLCYDIWNRYIAAPVREALYLDGYNFAELPLFIIKYVLNFFENFIEVISDNDFARLLQFTLSVLTFFFILVLIILTLIAAIKGMTQKNVSSCSSLGSAMITFSAIIYAIHIILVLIPFFLYSGSFFFRQAYIGTPDFWIEEFVMFIIALLPPVLYKIAAATAK